MFDRGACVSSIPNQAFRTLSSSKTLKLTRFNILPSAAAHAIYRINYNWHLGFSFRGGLDCMSLDTSQRPESITTTRVVHQRSIHVLHVYIRLEIFFHSLVISILMPWSMVAGRLSLLARYPIISPPWPVVTAVPFQKEKAVGAIPHSRTTRSVE